MSAPSRSEGFLGTMELQVAVGAAGEDRAQAVCSKEDEDGHSWIISLKAQNSFNRESSILLKEL
ncbi:hypothetical protein SAY86_029510 [Trapa natans]|uniref:Uncharacterized protein n=1 Tax=Trapa natans TaxID=22666 RepID=A0AAN7M2B2_TRANT|nr:hypothetical protein SAY86_029510 [Trapa natans]